METRTFNDNPKQEAFHVLFLFLPFSSLLSSCLNKALVIFISTLDSCKQIDTVIQCLIILEVNQAPQKVK